MTHHRRIVLWWHLKLESGGKRWLDCIEQCWSRPNWAHCTNWADSTGLFCRLHGLGITDILCNHCPLPAHMSVRENIINDMWSLLGSIISSSFTLSFNAVFSKYSTSYQYFEVSIGIAWQVERSLSKVTAQGNERCISYTLILIRHSRLSLILNPISPPIAVPILH